MKLRTLLTFSAPSLLLMLSPIAFAVTLGVQPSSSTSDTTLTGSSIDTDIQNLIAGYGTSMVSGSGGINDTSYLFPKNGTPKISTTQTVAGNESVLMPGTNIGPYQMINGAPATQQSIQSLLSVSDATIPLQNIVKSECPAPSGLFGSSSSCQPKVIPPNPQTLDMSSFINPLAYSDNGAIAQSFMNYVTGQNVPNVLYSSTPDFQNKLAAQGTYGLALQYLFAARTYAANISVGLANLQHLFQERIPMQYPLQDTNGNPVNSPVPGVSNPSPLQIDEYAAKRRAIDPTWYTSMETAGPAVIQRETLYVLAELRLEMFKTRMEMERLVAIASTTSSQQGAITANSAMSLLQNQLNPPSVPIGNTPSSTVTPGT